MAQTKRRVTRFDEDNEEVSRSQRKREATAIQKLGEKLTELGPASLRTLDLSHDIMTAVIEWHSLPTREAKRRHLQFIGRLMRDVDTDAIAEAVEALSAPHRESTTVFHELEALRERLLEEGPEAVDEVISRWPHADRQQLRQLVRNAQSERKAGRPPRNFRLLFKLLREIEASAPDADEHEVKVTPAK